MASSSTKVISAQKFDNIPQIIALNKADLLDENSIEALKRQISLDNNAQVVSISAIRPETLKPLVVRIGEILAKDLTERDSQFRVQNQII